MFAFILKWADKHIHKSVNDSETSLIALSHLLRNTFSLVYNTEFDVFAKNLIQVAVVGNKYLIRSHLTFGRTRKFISPRWYPSWILPRIRNQVLKKSREMAIFLS